MLVLEEWRQSCEHWWREGWMWRWVGREEGGEEVGRKRREEEGEEVGRKRREEEGEEVGRINGVMRKVSLDRAIRRITSRREHCNIQDKSIHSCDRHRTLPLSNKSIVCLVVQWNLS